MSDAPLRLRQMGHVPRQLRQRRLHDPLLWLPALNPGVSMLTKSYEYIVLVYAGDSPSGKTQIWRVETKYGDLLGVVRWFGRWRQYTFWPSAETLYSAGCLADIADFIGSLRNARRAG